jgi:hypothetical protein
VDGTRCAGVRETGSDGGIASPMAEELAGGERVNTGGERG